MGFIENTLHPDRKRQENWRRFGNEVGGIFIVEGVSGSDEVHIPFMDHRVQLSTLTERRSSRTVLTSRYSGDGFQFKIFGWGGRSVPKADRDPYLNSEFPDLAPRIKVEFNDSKKFTSLLESPDLRQMLLEAPSFFTLEATSSLLRFDNCAHDSKENGVITDVNHLHSAFNLFKCALYRLEAIGPASADDVENAPIAEQLLAVA